MEILGPETHADYEWFLTESKFGYNNNANDNLRRNEQSQAWTTTRPTFWSVGDNRPREPLSVQGLLQPAELKVK